MTEEQIEQKAEKYAKNLLKDVTCNIGHPRARQINSIDIEDAWLYGYKEGFKDCEKEHEWHYVKDGDLPSDRHGHVVINQDWDKVTIRNGRFEHLDGGKADVIAWKEIVFPKESE